MLGEILRVSSDSTPRSHTLPQRKKLEVDRSISGLEGLSSSVARHMRGKGIDEATDPQRLAFEPILKLSLIHI
jgi:hypothetical protein